MKKRQYVIVIATILVLSGYFVTQIYGDFFNTYQFTYDFYSTGEIETDNDIYVSGYFEDEPVIKSDVSRYGITGFSYNNYQVEGYENDSQSNAYNVFTIDDLQPSTIYNMDLSLNIKSNTDNNTELLITYSDSPITTSNVMEEGYNKYGVGFDNTELEDGSVLFNIFNHNTYIEGNINILTDENGTATIILRISDESGGDLDYNISNLSIDLTIDELMIQEDDLDDVRDGAYDGENNFAD